MTVAGAGDRRRRFFSSSTGSRFAAQIVALKVLACFAYVAHAERRDISDVAGQEAADLAGWIERGLGRAGC